MPMARTFVMGWYSNKKLLDTGRRTLELIKLKKTGGIDKACCHITPSPLHCFHFVLGSRRIELGTVLHLPALLPEGQTDRITQLQHSHCRFSNTW